MVLWVITDIILNSRIQRTEVALRAYTIHFTIWSVGTEGIWLLYQYLLLIQSSGCIIRTLRFRELVIYKEHSRNDANWFRNIDRLFAIWQALHEDVNNPETYVTEKPSNWGSFAINVGDPENAETYLYPFRDTKTSWFTSEKAKRTEPFGHAYPETKGLHYPTSESEKEALIQLINEFYTDLSFHIRKSQKKIENAGEELLPQAWVLGTLSDKNVTANSREMMTLVSDIPTRQTLLQNSLKPSKPFLRDLAPENKYLEWLVNV